MKLILLITLALPTLWSAPAAAADTKRVEAPHPGASRTVSYKSFKGAEMKLAAWEGQHVVVLAPRSDLEPDIMSRITAGLDRVYECYRSYTGQEPTHNPQTTVNGRCTFAVVADACGGAPACGWLGTTGIEILPPWFDELYQAMKDNDEFTTIPSYEFGRNFWFYKQKIEYLGSDFSGSGCITTGYAVFMRFMAMEGAALKGAPWNGHPFAEFVRGVQGLVDAYAADKSLTWTNTLRVYKAPPNPLGLNGTDLFASFLFRLHRDYGSNEFVKKLWVEVSRRPDAESTQDAVDNFVVAASRAAGRDLASLFRDEWRWPLSDEAVTEIRTGSPSRKPNEAILEKYVYNGGYFAKRAKPGPRQWKESKTDSTTAFFFEELVRDDQHIFLKDASRGLTVRIPVRGGESSISRDNGATWLKLYDLKKE